VREGDRGGEEEGRFEKGEGRGGQERAGEGRRGQERAAMDGATRVIYLQSRGLAPGPGGAMGVRVESRNAVGIQIGRRA
jgi:hypothetical protein